ncbi:phosphoribosylanthranilate isomerase [Cecembia rubra]|uniref:Phosphoribosylanthranilate isomerase n=1 Tax=Cecembia rubra TaxID=1485585 RepID=A0A2P8DYL1_9BACT|nr:phosphoribosylanthranilate isomerase [Cecembia rubra]PSL02314.1 phosphoribosylanthranilate isomerase [Cecembia rubra]
MALRTFVKISSVNNLSDARYCAGMQINLMGFCIEENNKNYISPEKFKEITGWLSGLQYVAEFEYSHPENILDKIKSYEGIEFIQVRNELHLNMLANTGYSLILHKDISSLNELNELVNKAGIYSQLGVSILLTSSNLEMDGDLVEKLKEFAAVCSVLLGFGLNANTIIDLLDKTGVKGIAMEGGDEIKPGLKDFDDLAEILETLEIED